MVETTARGAFVIPLTTKASVPPPPVSTTPAGELTTPTPEDVEAVGVLTVPDGELRVPVSVPGVPLTGCHNPTLLGADPATMRVLPDVVIPCPAVGLLPVHPSLDNRFPLVSKVRRPAAGDGPYASMVPVTRKFPLESNTKLPAPSQPVDPFQVLAHTSLPEGSTLRTKKSKSQVLKFALLH